MMTTANIWGFAKKIVFEVFVSLLFDLYFDKNCYKTHKKSEKFISVKLS